MNDIQPSAPAELALPNFIIPVGTQVVLKADTRVPGRDRLVPKGSVAEVLESPANNARPYVVRLFDGTSLRVSVGQLALRRHGLDDELTTPTPDLREFVIYRVEVGSRAFGLATAESDSDLRGVFLPPAEFGWSLFKPPEQFESARDGVEEVDWELEKYLRLALQANPNVLETLWAPTVVTITEVGQELRDMRAAFLSRHLYKTYSGYVLSQFKLMAKNREKTGTFRVKHAMHLIRLLHSGIHALTRGELFIDVGEHRDELLAIRTGHVGFEEIKERALELSGRFGAAFVHTDLPERPDYDRVNRFLIRARRRMVR